MNACTTNPPPNESSANSPDRRTTTRLDWCSWTRRAGFACGASTPFDSEPATTAPAIATGTKSRNQVWSDGALLHTRWSKPGSPDAKAPTAPAAVAIAL